MKLRSTIPLLRALAAAAAIALLAIPAPVRVASAADRELRVALTQEPATLSPVVATLAIESDLMQFLFDGLTRYDERGNQVPDLAVRVPTVANGGIAADGRSITYHLVHNARWHDGAPVTSADVAFTFAAITNPANNVVGTDPYDKIARVETPDAYTVRLVLKQPWAPAIDAFSNRIGSSILPAHLLKSYPDLNHIDYNAAPIGSGPYKFVAWHHGSDLELVANDEYFRGAPKIKRVVIRFLASDNTMLIALRSHELDIADRLNLSTFTNLGPVPGMVPATTTQSFWEHLTFNTARPPLDDVRVRQALCYAFDAADLLQKVAHGLGALGPTNQNPLTPWYNRKIHDYPYDPAKAAKLLDAAGWRVGAGGMRVKNGQPLSLTLNFPAGNISREQTGVLLQQRWKEIGVDIVIKTYPPPTFFATAANGGPYYGGKNDISMSAYIQAVPDPNGVSVNNSDAIPPHGNNVSFYVNPELTRLENAAAATPIVAERKALYDRIQDIEIAQLPYYTLRWSELTDMRSADLIGVKPPLIGSTFWNVGDWKFAGR